MKYSSLNLHETGMPLPLPCATKLIVEYRSVGVAIDWAPPLYSVDPEGAADKIVLEKGWHERADYDPKNVRVNAAF